MNNVTRDPIPLYFQIQKIIRTQIEAGQFEAGQKIPSEIELCRKYNVSRITMKRALENLVGEGFLYRKRGKGTFVTEKEHQVRSFSLMGPLGAIFCTGQVAELYWAEIQIVPSPEIVKKFFSLNQHGRVVQVKRVRGFDELPAIYSMNYLSMDKGTIIQVEDLKTHSMCEIIEQKLGLLIHVVHQTMQAVSPTEEVCKALSIDFSTPVLYIRSTMFGEGGLPLNLTESYLRGDKFKYYFEFNRDQLFHDLKGF